MSIPDSFVSGTVFFAGSNKALGELLVSAGFTVQVGYWAVRIAGCARAFELAYVGNITPEEPFQVEGSGYGVPVEQVAQCCERLARCLRLNSVGFDFTHFTADEQEINTYEFAPIAGGP